MADPESVVINAINGNGGWVTNTNLFRGPVMPDEDYGIVIPRLAVFVHLTGGPAPIDFSQGDGAGAVSPQEFEFNVQTMIRGEPRKYGTTRTLAQAIWTLLHDTDPSGYISVRNTMTAPVYVGVDERRSPIFVINTRLLLLE